MPDQSSTGPVVQPTLQTAADARTQTAADPVTAQVRARTDAKLVNGGWPAATPLALENPTGGPGGSSTDATYTQGPANRPPIQHDNGFLQNPNDPNDPNPIATTRPGPGDYLALAKWRGQLELAEAAQGVPGAPHNDIPDGLAAYRHFLDGGGKDRTIDYERYVAGDPSGKVMLNSATRDTQLGAEQIYSDMLAKDPSLAGKPVTFEMTGSAIPVGGGNPGYPYPETENWQKAIGAHDIWNSAKVTVTPPTEPGGKPQFNMDMTVHMEDRYNFNPGAADIATGTMDAENGRFEKVGLAHQYMNYGTLDRQVSWGQGDVQPTSTGGGAGRQPDDNRRVRNRT